jgi:type II secretory pathway pseudopilin PulG
MKIFKLILTIFWIVICLGCAREPRCVYTYEKAVQSQLSLFRTALSMYKLNLGTYPAKLDYLWVCPPRMDPRDWQGPYMEGTEVIDKDSWGRPYHVALYDDGQKCRVTSAGPDREFLTADDIHMDYFN